MVKISAELDKKPFDKIQLTPKLLLLFSLFRFLFQKLKKSLSFVVIEKRNSPCHLNVNCTLVITGRKQASNEMWTGAIFSRVIFHINVLCPDATLLTETRQCTDTPVALTAAEAGFNPIYLLHYLLLEREMLYK